MPDEKPNPLVGGMSEPNVYESSAPDPLHLGRFVIKRLGYPNVDQIKNNQHRVLDIGCGAGRIAQELKRVGWQVTATDINERMVHQARLRGVDAHTIPAQATRYSFEGNSFDFVISNATLHWLPETGLEDTLAGIAHVLKPGGRFINSHVCDPTVGGLITAMERAFKDFGIPFKSPWLLISSEELQEKLNAAGFNTNANTVRTESYTVSLPLGAEGWIRTFAPYFCDRKESLNTTELERVAGLGGIIFAKIEPDSAKRNVVTYYRHVVDVTCEKQVSKAQGFSDRIQEVREQGKFAVSRL